MHRQARVLLEAGHRVTLVSSDPGDNARRLDPPGLERVFVPRASGRRRIASWWAMRRALVPLRASADVMLIHDPELVRVVTSARRGRSVFVWDVHEDFVAMAHDTVWMPKSLRSLLAAVVRGVEWYAKKRCHIVIAEDGYARRFRGAPVVPNTTWVSDQAAPLDDDPRVVYVGRVSFDRGVSELVALGEELASRSGPRVVVIGAADAECHDLVADAHARGVVDWRGPVSNPEAMNIVRGAVAGLSLLHEIPNYVVSRPTKVIEYLACGTPVITTPLPLAALMVADSGVGVATSAWTGDAVVREAADAVMSFVANPQRRVDEGEAGWRFVRDHWSWNADGPRFVAVLADFVSDVR
ncbi:MAG: glycosyltransferase [Actinomycetota bacterium]